MAGGAPQALRDRADPLRGIPIPAAGLVAHEPLLERVVAQSVRVTHSAVGFIGLLATGDHLELVAGRRMPGSPRTFLGVPLRLDGPVVGVLGVGNKRSPYTSADENVLAVFADCAMLAIDNARLQRRQRDIAGDIHDDVMQRLSAVELRIQRLRTRIPPGPERRLLEDVSATVTQTDDALRLLLLDLRRPAVDLALGLSAAIRTRLRMLERETGIRCEVRTVPDLDVDPATARTVLRLVQEAVANAATHSGATRLRVGLDRRDGGVHVRVRDDGCGFVTGAVHTAPGHLGLTLARERIDRAGGWLRLESEPGAGTTLEFWVPLACHR